MRLLDDLRTNKVTLIGFVSASVATQFALYFLSPGFVQAPMAVALGLLAVFGVTVGLVSTLYHVALVRERETRRAHETEASGLRDENERLARLFQGVARDQRQRTPKPRARDSLSRGAFMIHNEVSAYHLFAAALAEGQQGLILSRHPPAAVWERIGTEGIPVIWLAGSKDADATPPTSVDLIFRAVRRFRERGGNIVLVDVVEYLVAHNDFPTVLKLVHAMQDEATKGEFRVVFHVRREAFDSRSLALLSRDCTLISSATPEYMAISP